MKRSRSTAMAVVLCTAVLAGVGEQPAPASAGAASLSGSAFGYWADEIKFFGNDQEDIGPVPSVLLAPDASNSPQAATASTGSVIYGPATLFTSGQIDVSTSGSLSETGSASSSTHIEDVNASRLEIFGEDNYDCCDLRGESFDAPSPRPLTDVASTCTGSGAGFSGSTTIDNGWLYLDNGYSDYDLVFPEPAALTFLGIEEHKPVKVAIPTNPAPGTTYTGHIHINSAIDYYTVVFNDQVRNPDGSLTVNAVHEIFGTDPPGHNSNLKGHLYLGQSVCGVTTVNDAPDLSITMSDAPDPAKVGTNITYTVAVANAGPGTASGVSVAFSPTGTTHVSVSGGTCTVGKGKQGGVRCELGDMAAGGTKTLTVVVKAPTKAGTVSASATVSATTNDPNTSNNTATAGTSVTK